MTTVTTTYRPRRVALRSREREGVQGTSVIFALRPTEASFVSREDDGGDLH